MPSRSCSRCHRDWTASWSVDRDGENMDGNHDNDLCVSLCLSMYLCLCLSSYLSLCLSLNDAYQQPIKMRPYRAQTCSLRRRRPTKYAAIGIRRYLVAGEGHWYCHLQFTIAMYYILADHPKSWCQGAPKVSNNLSEGQTWGVSTLEANFWHRWGSNTYWA